MSEERKARVKRLMDTSPVERLVEGKPMKSYRDLALKGGATGSTSGKVARFGALEQLIKRRQDKKRSMEGAAAGSDRVTSKGVAGAADQDFDVEGMISGRKRRP